MQSEIKKVKIKGQSVQQKENKATLDRWEMWRE